MATESLSQQDVYVPPKFMERRSESLDSFLSQRKSLPKGFISEDDDQALRAKFEKNLLEIVAANIESKSKLESSFILIYTIGRFNPPQPGHITMLFEMIDKAIEDSEGNTIPFKILIFAGSGPKNNDKTSENAAVLNILDNPISFEEKKQIIEAILALRYDSHFIEQNIDIIEMGFVPQQVSLAMQVIKNETPETIIISFRGASDKDGGDDLKKSTYSDDYLKKFARENGIKYIPGVLPIKAVNIGEKPASATRVRVDAINMSKGDFLETYLPQYEKLFESAHGLVSPMIKAKLVSIIGKIYDDIHLGIHDRMIREILTDKNGQLYILTHENGEPYILTDENGEPYVGQDAKYKAIQAYIDKNKREYSINEGKSVASANIPPIKQKPPKKAAPKKAAPKKEDIYIDEKILAKRKTPLEKEEEETAGGSRKRKTKRRKTKNRRLTKTKRRKSRKHRKSKRRHR